MEDNRLLVSVITCYYNEERFLKEAIESVITQDYTRWELILVDDGSSDSSPGIAHSYQILYPGKIKCISHPGRRNMGLSASRNLGISESTGSLVAFLDADDVWLSSKLSSQVSILERHKNVSLLAEASLYWHSWSDKTVKQDIIIRVGQIQDAVFEPPALAETLYPLSSGDAPCPSGLMVRREALLKHGCFEAHFTGKFQMYEDQAFLQKFYLNEVVYVSSECNNKYRQREGSLVNQITKDGEYESVRMYFLNWLETYISKNNIQHKNVSMLIASAKADMRSGPLSRITRRVRNLLSWYVSPMLSNKKAR